MSVPYYIADVAPCHAAVTNCLCSFAGSSVHGGCLCLQEPRKAGHTSLQLGPTMRCEVCGTPRSARQGRCVHLRHAKCVLGAASLRALVHCDSQA